MVANGNGNGGGNGDDGSGAGLVVARSWPELDASVRQLIRTRRSIHTRRAYESDWGRWESFVRSTGVDPMNPGLAATTEFRDRMVAEYAPATTNRVLATLSFFYAAFRDLGLLRTNPFSGTWLPRPEVGDLHKTPAVDDGDARRILSALEADGTRSGLRDLAIIRILYDTGLRRESTATLRRDQIRREGDEVVAIVKIKGGREKRVTLTAGVVAALDAWLSIAPSSAFVFPSRHRDAHSSHINLATINRTVSVRSKIAGVTSRVTPHQFRAAFITTAYDARIYERDIQDAAHHASADTTRGYDRGRRGDNVVTKIAEHRANRHKGASKR